MKKMHSSEKGTAKLYLLSPVPTPAPPGPLLVLAPGVGLDVLFSLSKLWKKECRTSLCLGVCTPPPGVVAPVGLCAPPAAGLVGRLCPPLPLCPLARSIGSPPAPNEGDVRPKPTLLCLGLEAPVVPPTVSVGVARPSRSLSRSAPDLPLRPDLLVRAPPSLDEEPRVPSSCRSCIALSTLGRLRLLLPMGPTTLRCPPSFATSASSSAPTAAASRLALAAEEV